MLQTEAWNKIWCPECKAINWVCLGDLNDCTQMDCEAVICHQCNKKIVLIDIHESYASELEGNEDEPPMTKEDIISNLYTEKGLEKPR